MIGDLSIHVGNFRGRGVQLLAQDSEPLSKTRAKEAIVAHLNKAGYYSGCHEIGCFKLSALVPEGGSGESISF